MINNLIYFDNAATGYPKPQRVKYAVLRAFDEYGGNPGRSGHILSSEASKAVYRCREEVCALLRFDAPERVVFTLNATHALNMAIKGVAEKGDHIVISNLEHNSVYRPVFSLSSDPSNQISFSVFDAVSNNDDVITERFISALKEDTRLAVITHASNICGKILPVKKMADECHKRGIKIIVDASQTMGHVDIQFNEVNADVICTAGHKGLYGPPGTGFAVFSKHIEPRAILEGGNGLVSSLPDMGDYLPEKLEAGTVNTAGICGLCEGIRFIRERGICSIAEECERIDRYVSDELNHLGAVVYSKFDKKTPITLFNIPGMSADLVAAFLDNNGICTRGGIHCAPLAHKALFTGNNGAVRASYGYANTMSEAYRFVSMIRELTKNK